MRAGMSAVRGGAAAPAMATSIPGSARKVIQNLKELDTGHGDDEIYALLKECNMDPNEAAQRLMNQDTFHEVKRKRDRKKEAVSSNKEVFESRSRGGGAYRGGRGGGRGGSASRYTSNESNGRGRGLPAKENGPSAPDSKPTPQPSVQSGSAGGGSQGLPNGYVPTVAPTQGSSWSNKIASGHATMADMLKSSNNRSQPPNLLTIGAAGQQHFPAPGMYSTSDPVHHPFSDQRVLGNLKGNQRPIGDRTTAAGGGLPSPTSTSQDEAAGSPPRQQERAKSHDSASSNEALRQPPSFRAAAAGNGRPIYQQQPANVNKPGANLEWKPKLATQGSAMESVVSEALTSPSPTISEPEVLSVSSKFQNLSTRDEEPSPQQQVIMPNNFQPQGDLGLSFGSFGEGFGSSLPSGFSSEDGLDISAPSETSAPPKDILHEQSPSPTDSVTAEDSSIRQDEAPVQRESISANTTTSVPSNYNTTSQADNVKQLRSSAVTQQAQQQYSSYLQSPPASYSSGFSQIPSSQHGFDSQDSQLQDISNPAATMKQHHYPDSATSYYSPAGLRPTSEGDSRYGQYTPGKYTNGAVLVSGQHLPHEVTSSTALSSSGTATQAPQTGATHPTGPQQPLPVHAYPAQPTGMPVGHFGNVFSYQYPGYTFVPSPYQHSYTASYPQPPVSSYAPSNYTPAGVATVKYTALPQYKPGTVNAPLSAVTAGYGGYGTASSMYAGGNPTATGTNAAGYEDATSSQYKDSNLYIHGPQGDGARLWQLSNDVTSSFYALSSQNQHHTSYTQPSSHTHPIAGYTSLYHHPQQPGPGASAHTMIQQPQTLSNAAGSTQVGGAATTYHQQLQRMQQPNWNAY